MQEVENIYAKKIFKEFSDYVELPEISNYLNATKFVAKDGKHIAFLDSDSLAIFACADKSLVRVHTGAVDPIGITNVCMVKNLVVVIKNISPYIEIYKIENNVCVNQDVYKVSYDESSYSYDFKAVDCTLFGENELFVGVVINGTNTGLVLRFVDTYDGFILTSINQNSLGQTTNVYAAIKDNNCNGKIIFLTNAYDNPVFSSAIQVFDGTMNSAGAFSQAEEFIGASNITVHGKWLLMHTLESPYAYSYDTETFSRVSFVDGAFYGEVIPSYDMQNLLTIDSSGEYILYNFISQDNLELIDNSIFAEIGKDSIKDVVFLENVVLIFTSEKVLILSKFNNYVLLENLPLSESNYEINCTKYDLLGSKEYEGVQTSLTITF